ncbi:MAG TPA: hypothetical protein P5518_07335 [Candidatus Cloacimonas sp.]|nr:hypothetical protein [Candidatus Cloacimonas sp.]HOQ77258.1 hypothetical protein [Candidatus Cloacimonas sp.]HPH71112.1 hypothetical protein [Candidatus Cloacimonas sp.]HQB49739.1 hypothetical protein [Candidatus Cloacimonas sp.]HQJ96289.1 hypothetical protein [Candidatus Cloacimonas sp.]
MKKRILFFFLSLFLLCSPYWKAQTQGLDWTVYSSQQVLSIENALQYRFYPTAKTSLVINSKSNIENRLNFNQEAKNADLNVGLELMSKHFMHTISSDYQTFYDNSDLEPAAYVNKTAILGYHINYSPVDSLNIGIFSKGILRNEQDRYVNGYSLSSEGYWFGSNASYSNYILNSIAGISANAERKRMDWESFDYANLGANYNYYGNYLNFACLANYNYHSEDIYVLAAPEQNEIRSNYQLSDNQLRWNFDISGNLQYSPEDRVQLEIRDNYSLRQTSYSKSEIRNNTDHYNQAQLHLDYQISQKVSWQSDLAHTYAIKDYYYDLNTRQTDNRHIGSRINWEYSEGDSLIAAYFVNLQIIKFPEDDNQWDNDLLTHNLRFGWKHYWHERVVLGNWFGYSFSKDVYIDSLLSANNKEISSWTMFPECKFLIGDRIAFFQTYQIRADYSDYIYNTGKNNTLYRQLGYQYNLVFDTFPLIARTLDPRWLELPFRNSPENAFMIDLGFAYEENQYAQQKQSYYELQTKNRRWTASIDFRHDIKNLYWTLSPQYTWGTWKELTFNLNSACLFNNNSLIEFKLAPFIDNFENIDSVSFHNFSANKFFKMVKQCSEAADWRLSTTLRLYF